MQSVVLVTGPVVGTLSWRPTADRLRAAGARVSVPDVLAARGTPPPWHEWSTHLAALIAAEDAPVLVGHSSASVLIADLASKGPVRGLIIVDGDIPPAHGPAAPVRPALRDFIRTLSDADGLLPPWSRWWSDPRRAALVGIDALARDAAAFAAFEAGLPRMSLAWFDDAIELAPWAHIGAGYIQTSAIYAHAAEEAVRRAWPVLRLEGTHLHPTLAPDETAAAIQTICRAIA